MTTNIPKPSQDLKLSKEEFLEHCIIPDWPKPKNVHALITTRKIPGHSQAPYDKFNLAEHVKDNASAVKQNRQLLEGAIDAKCTWLQQTHSTNIVQLKNSDAVKGSFDGAYTREKEIACTIMTADCMPIFLCDKEGKQVMCLHAGWRGLAAGILTQGVELFPKGAELMAYLGPAISQKYFEVGGEVKQLFEDAGKQRGFLNLVDFAFKPSGEHDDKYFADLYLLAKFELEALGLSEVCGSGICTVGQGDVFYSFRKEGGTGRFGSVVWLG